MQSVQNYARTVELWNIALDPNDGPHTGGCPDCLGVVTINQSTGNVIYTNDYYQVGQFSKFVVPGAYHITSNNVGSVASAAFKNADGSKVLVAHNDGSSSSTFQVVWGNQGFNYTLPAGATVTFKWSGTQQNTLTNGGYAITMGGASGAFQADNYYIGGYSNTATVTDTISTGGVSNAAPQAVYQNERYGNFSYVFPSLQAGASYTVRLHFAETYWTSAGQRLFNVSLNGNQVLSSFDIEATTGGKDKATVQQFTATADSNGQITAQFSSVVDYAKVDGIEIIASGSTGSTPTPTPTASGSTPTPTPTASGSAPIGKTIWLRATNNSDYVSTRIDQTNNPLDANAIQVQAWEEFDVVDAGGGLIALRAHANNDYVSARIDQTNSPLQAVATQVQAWEEFTWLPQSDGTIALRAQGNGDYVSTRTDQTNTPLDANVTLIQGWEKFTWGLV
jgi:hypothetical protein